MSLNDIILKELHHFLTKHCTVTICAYNMGEVAYTWASQKMGIAKKVKKWEREREDHKNVEKFGRPKKWGRIFSYPRHCTKMFRFFMHFFF